VTAPKPDDRALVSARLLIDLVTNTLDPGYAAAAARRRPDTRPRRFDRPAVAVGCLLIGFLLVLAYVHTHRAAPEAAKVHDRLVSRVLRAEKPTSVAWKPRRTRRCPRAAPPPAISPGCRPGSCPPPVPASP
jgi:hypothetical protein